MRCAGWMPPWAGLLPVIGLSIAVAPAALAQGPGNVLVVVNDASEDSTTIAGYYANKRSIPEENLCHIRTTQEESISRELFEQTIQQPVANCLREKNLQDQILYIVTTKGTPLIVEGDGSPVGDLASVDSELATLYSYLLSGHYNPYGRIENPYFQPVYEDAVFRPFSRQQQQIYLVTRLTGYAVVDTFFLIDRGFAQPGNGTFYFELPSRQESEGVDWARQAAAQLKKMGQAVQLQQPGAASTPVGPIQGYFGWVKPGQSSDMPPADFKWQPSAIATMIDPDSAKTFARNGGKGSLAADLIEAGVAGFGGHIADPTLDGQIRPQILFPSYAAGYNLAESFFRALRYLSWRQIIVGDPLASAYRSQSEAKRSALAADFNPGISAETGLPRYFSERRKLLLKRKYSTTDEAVSRQLKAEGLAAGKKFEEASRVLTESIERDPYLVESHLLLGEISEKEARYEEAFGHYQKSLELGESSKDANLKLARLALDKLHEAAKAFPYAQWLYVHFGAREQKIALMWADVQYQTGDLQRAESLYLHLLKTNDPDPVIVLKRLGQIYRQQQKWDLAESFLQRALNEALKLSDENHRAPDQMPLSGTELRDLQALLEETKTAKGSEDTAVELVGDSATSDPDVESAKVLSRVSPKYPARAREQGVEGTVSLRLLIDERGQMVKVEPISGHPWLIRAVQEALGEWHFQPKRVKRKPQPSWLTISIRFRIEKK